MVYGDQGCCVSRCHSFVRRCRSLPKLTPCPPNIDSCTMSSQIRYRTLVDHLTRIYDANKETRTGRLQEGLTRVLEAIDPKGAEGWQHVKADTMRLLRVWLAREDCPGANEFAEQILGSLSDFASEEETVPRLEISERPAPVLVIKPDPAERIPTQRPIPVAVQKPMTQSEAAAIEAALAVALAAEEEEEEVEVEPEVTLDEDEEEESVVEVPPTEEKEATTVATEEEEEEEDATDEEEETPEVATEVVEPDADSETEEDEDEEEEGVEVEKRTIRGREYWLSSDGTLYAVTEDDEIGDEVGRITKEGRPVFLAPK